MQNPLMEEMNDLRVLRLTEYEQYQLPFQAQQITITDIFVDDLRDDNDESLNLVPRITSFEQLKNVFKLDIDHSLGSDAVTPGNMYWAIIGFYLRTGTAAFIPKVLGGNGQPPPPPGAFVFAHWPGADPIDANPKYHSNAVGGFTNINGDIGFGYFGDAVTGVNGGVYDIWVSADPPNGTRFYSDMAIRLGWFGGTDHLTPNPIFQAIRKSGTEPPTGGDSRLVVYDGQGNEVGYMPLITESMSGGRIALVTDGRELAHAELILSV